MCRRVNVSCSFVHAGKFLLFCQHFVNLRLLASNHFGLSKMYGIKLCHIFYMFPPFILATNSLELFRRLYFIWFPIRKNKFVNSGQLIFSFSRKRKHSLHSCDSLFSSSFTITFSPTCILFLLAVIHTYANTQTHPQHYSLRYICNIVKHIQNGIRTGILRTLKLDAKNFSQHTKIF